MKILFLNRSLACGGAERQLVALARGLRERGHEVSVAIFYPGGSLERELRQDEIRIISLDKHGRWDVIGFLVRLCRTVLEIRPDIVHSYIGNLVTIAIKPFAPSSKIVWGVRCSYLDFGRYDWLVRVSHALSCWLSNSADLIIANSYAGRNEHVADGYPAGKTIVIPNGIDTTLFCPNQVSRTKIRLEWGVAEHEELVGLVGRLDPMKDHETFLRAAQLTSRSRKTARFVCVGDGRPEYRAALKECARLLGLSDRILWVGTRSDMTDVYNALDLLVSCSYGEGFSNVIGEAMACGVPCVVTNVGDSRFIVGEFGSAVEPKDAESLHLAIMRSLSDKHDSPGIRRRIVEQFSLQRLILATESELLSLCHQSAPSSVSPTIRPSDHCAGKKACF